MTNLKKRRVILEWEVKHCYLWSFFSFLLLGFTIRYTSSHWLGLTCIFLGFFLFFRGCLLGAQKTWQDEFRRFFGYYPPQIHDASLQITVNWRLSKLYGRQMKAERAAKISAPEYIADALMEADFCRSEFFEAKRTATHFGYKDNQWPDYCCGSIPSDS